MNETELFNKEGFSFTKSGKNNYHFTFNVTNENIYIEKILDFHLLKVIYDLNPDIYEKSQVNIINETEAEITLLLKHFFKDIGLPQRYSFVHMTKTVEHNLISFSGKSILTKPDNIPCDVQLLPINNVTSAFQILSPHTAMITFHIIFENYLVVPTFAEKIIGLLLFKLFKRTKQFIENIII